MDVRPACKNISAPKKALLAPAMTAIRSPAGQACWRTSYGSFEASESWGWWTNILNLNLADLEQTPPSPMQAKRARRVPRAADARHDHFDLDANDATAESDFGETQLASSGPASVCPELARPPHTSH